MRVPQWREDVLGWASKRGYKETGGGVWGELDGETAEDLARPTRYFVLTVSERKTSREVNQIALLAIDISLAFVQCLRVRWVPGVPIKVKVTPFAYLGL